MLCSLTVPVQAANKSNITWIKKLDNEDPIG